MSKRSNIKAIYILLHVMNMYQMDHYNLRSVSIYLEKMYDIVPREILWKLLEKKKIMIAYIRAIQEMHEGVLVSVMTHRGETSDFLITMGLHQDAILSLYFFTFVLDVLT